MFTKQIVLKYTVRVALRTSAPAAAVCVEPDTTAAETNN